jgi:hypothetical protein
MNTTHRKTIVTTLAALLICTTALPMAFAQETPRGTVVVYPVVFSRNSGTSTSRRMAVEAVNAVLQKAGYTLISSTVAANAWRDFGFPMPTADRPPTLSDLVRLGKEVKAQYVISPVFDFNSRSIWVDLGPKTVSTATVDILIASVAQDKIVYNREDVSGRSDEKFDALLAGADLIGTPLVTMASGGPKTPHEQRAVRIAVVKAFRDWITKTTQ